MEMEREIQKKSLLKRWKKIEKKEQYANAIEKAPSHSSFPLSGGQQRLFFLEQLYPNNPVYNSSEIYNFKGPLIIEDLERSLKTIVFTNDSLRSSIHFESGKPVQKINDQIDFIVSKYDLSDLSFEQRDKKREEILKADSLQSFDLTNSPLIRFLIIKLAEEEHLLFVTTHHIVTDKWSMGLFEKQLAKFYRDEYSIDEIRGDKLNKIEFSDYTYWQQQTEIDQAQLDYWKEKLSGETPLLALPTDYPQTIKPTFKGGSHVQNISKELSSKVLELCKKFDTTPYVFLLAVYYALLHRYSGQKDILVGSPISFRNSSQLDDIIGFFDETIVLRTALKEDMSFSQLLREVRSTVLDAFSNKDIPFDVLVKELKPERTLSGNPFFRTMFIYHDVPAKPFFDAEIEMTNTFYNTGISKFDLTMYVADEDGVLSTEFEYSKDLFDLKTIKRLQEHFSLLLECITEDPSTEINKIPMLTQEELELLKPKEYSNRHFLDAHLGIHEIIVAKAKENPNGIALAIGDEKMTYKKLDEEANLIAQRILDLTKGENEIVGLCIERSLNMIVGLLGILKAGCAYLPIDLNYPSKRVDYTLQDSAINILVTQHQYLNEFKNFRGHLLPLEEKRDSKIAFTHDYPQVKEDDLAYVIYTSGSTGKPKGVPITHANIISSTAARLDFYPKNPEAFLLMSSISFDSSKAGLFWTLCTGGTLVISENQLEQDIEKLSRVIFENSVSHTLMLPSLYKMVLEYSDVSKLKSLQNVMVAGEECTTSLCAEHFEKLPDTLLYNEYGPTEATVWCIAHQIEKDDKQELVPIGKPISNAEVFLLNSAQELVPYGAIGEIYIGGSGLSGKYLNKQDLSNDSYIKPPFYEDSNKVLYKTGDLGKYTNEGTIVFLGRTDQQVKIRGFRIELSEIENALSNNPQILETVVLAENIGGSNDDQSKGSKKIIAYIVADSELDTKEIHTDLSKEIPSYMLPSRIIQIDKFPELPNGKVDKNALKILGLSISSRKAKKIDAPSNKIEADLLKIWEDILGSSAIGVKDNYFEIGGDSMISIRMFWLIEKELKVKLSPSILFVHPTIEGIARKISEVNSDRTDNFKHVIPYRQTGKSQPLFCIHGGEGHVLFYKDLAKYISEERPVYLVQPRGADGDDKLHESIEEMAHSYINEILQVQSTGPINFVFYCCGALVVEISNQLKAKGRTANVIIIDSSPRYIESQTVSKGEVRYEFYLKRVLSSPFTTIRKSIVYRFRRYVLPLYVSLLKDTSAKRHIKIRNRLEEVQNDYEWNTFDARCTLVIGTDGIVDFDKKDIAGWNHWCSSELTVSYSSGNHFNIFDEPHVKSLGVSVENACL
ncbi:MAG: amino acid adenylation domain-containing protein [Maribacter sp.]